MNLYHGSKFHHTQLMPGFKRTKVEKNWDNTESNKFLYATVEAQPAVGMGFASALDQSFMLKRFQHNDDVIRITIEEGPVPTKEDLAKIKVYLYTILYRQIDGWEKANNAHNNMSGEFRTAKTIKEAITNIRPYSMEDWLAKKKVTVIAPLGKPGWSGW